MVLIPTQPQHDGSRRRRRRVFWSVTALACAFVAWWGTGLAAAWLMTRGHPVAFAARAELGGRAVEAVATTTVDGLTVRGWLVSTAAASSRCVLLAAGIRGNRLAMQTRAEWYLANGWSALLVDLRGTGESDSARVSMGWHEALDLLAWHAFLRQRGFTAIGAHGQSLGAAAITFTAVRSDRAPVWHFVVLESCYRDAEVALRARLPGVPRFLLWPLEVSCAWLMQVDPAKLRPLAAIHSLNAPTLLACGTIDEKVGPDALALLLAASPARDKRRVDIAGAGHVDLWRAGGDTLPRALGEFLAGR